MLVTSEWKCTITVPSSWRVIAKKSVCYGLISSSLAKRVNSYLKAIPSEHYRFCEDTPRKWRAGSWWLTSREHRSCRAIRCTWCSWTLRQRSTQCPGTRLCSCWPRRMSLWMSAIFSLQFYIKQRNYWQGSDLTPAIYTESSCGSKRPPCLNLYLSKGSSWSNKRTEKISWSHLLCRRLNDIRIQQVPCTVTRLHATTELQLTINPAAVTIFNFAKSPFAYMNQFPFLGCLFSENDRTSTMRVNERYQKAVLATWATKSPHRLSFATVLSLIDFKAALTATYGICVIWEDFTLENLEQMNCVRASFLKRALQLTE